MVFYLGSKPAVVAGPVGDGAIDIALLHSVVQRRRVKPDLDLHSVVVQIFQIGNQLFGKMPVPSGKKVSIIRPGRQRGENVFDAGLKNAVEKIVVLKIIVGGRTA